MSDRHIIWDGVVGSFGLHYKRNQENGAIWFPCAPGRK
uniref:Uncharacterized protein n=1 Tax=viral metagenome TaxID=1070528 RepID=A0A6C0AG85_9ZZZZ